MTHPQAYNHATPNDAAQALIAEAAEVFRKQTGHEPLTVSDWGTILEEMRRMLKKMAAELRQKNYAEPKENRRQNRENLERWMNAAQSGVDQFERGIEQIAAMPVEAQRGALAALWANWAQHTAQLQGKVPGTAVGAPNWEAVTRTEIMLTSSERTFLRLGEALERGQFETPPMGRFPLADISGPMDGRNFAVHAELVHSPITTDLLTPEQQDFLQKLSADLADPRKAIGPRSQQAAEVLMHLWLTRRRADNAVAVHFSQLAEGMGFAKRTDGSFDPRDYETILESIRTLERLRLTVGQLPSLGGHRKKEALLRLEEQAFVFSYFDDAEEHARGRPSARWAALLFKPNEYFSRAASRQGALLMGASQEINRLHPVKERADLLLGKYLERHWRMNWNRERGAVTRTIEELVSNGMNLDASKPSKEALERLTNALDKLQERGVVLHWQADGEALDAVLDQASMPGRRMTRSLWSRALGVRLRIEAGNQYREHYRNFGLVTQNKGGQASTLAEELGEYLRKSGRSQAVVAQEVGISPSQLSRILSGARQPTAGIRQRLEALLQKEATLQLPLV